MKPITLAITIDVPDDTPESEVESAINNSLKWMLENERTRRDPKRRWTLHPAKIQGRIYIKPLKLDWEKARRSKHEKS
jgi:hypothetical protein